MNYGTYDKDGETFIATQAPEAANLAGFEGKQVFNCTANDLSGNEVIIWFAFESDEEEVSNLNWDDESAIVRIDK